MSGQHIPAVSANQAAALRALEQVYYRGEGHFLTFKGVAKRCDLEPRLVRRTVRALARKGLAEYGRGLMTEDGDFVGSGYACTELGAAVVASLPATDDDSAEVTLGSTTIRAAITQATQDQGGGHD